jgi:hypothetical protein
MSGFIDSVRRRTRSLCTRKGFLCGDKEVNVIKVKYEGCFIFFHLLFLIKNYAKNLTKCVSPIQYALWRLGKMEEDLRNKLNQGKNKYKANGRFKEVKEGEEIFGEIFDGNK